MTNVLSETTNGVELRAIDVDWKHSLALLFREIRGGREYVCKEITLQEVDPLMVTEPTVKIPYHNGQILMDDLWAAGFRPTEGAGSAGALAATQNHLADMRKLVFTYFNVEVKS